MLVSAFPGLAQSQPGSIQEPALPTLRHLIVVDNAFDVNLKAFHEEIGRAKCAVDFREVLVWREDGAPARTAEEVRKGLEKDDVVNLQFTRYGWVDGVRVDLTCMLCIKRHHWLAQSCLGEPTLSFAAARELIGPNAS